MWDALGRSVEFVSASEIKAEHGRVDKMVRHGPWKQPAGTLTDDTEQVLCIARSLVGHQTRHSIRRLPDPEPLKRIKIMSETDI